MQIQIGGMKKEEFGENVLIVGHRCYRCGHSWIPREKEPPQICPKCKSPYWNKPKTRFLEKDKNRGKKRGSRQV